MDGLRLAIIGCGINADAHAIAFKKAGFELSAVCARPGSQNVKPFAERHGVANVFDTVDALVDSSDLWDGVMIVVPVEENVDALDRVLRANKPILTEKPVAHRSSDLEPYLDRHVPILVAYNRRFFRPVIATKEEVSSNPKFLGHMVFPQMINTPKQTSDDPIYLQSYFASVNIHGLDMARFILGDLQVEHVQQLRNDGGSLLGIAGTLSTAKGSLLQFLGNFQASSNFSFTLDWPGKRFELRPLEFATIYEGMEVVEPTKELPMRTYKPKPSASIDLEDIDYKFKPGYVRQAEAFGKYIREGDTGSIAQLQDAYEALKLAEALAGEEYPN